jgi:hypothetical protein
MMHKLDGSQVCWLVAGHKESNMAQSGEVGPDAHQYRAFAGCLHSSATMLFDIILFVPFLDASSAGF